MNPVLQTILDTQKITFADGQEQTLHSAIDREEADFLRKIILEANCRKTLEVGCAMGISSLVICDAIRENDKTAEHLIIDPFQRTEWKSIGISNLEKAGLANYCLLEEPSEFVLPKLAEEGVAIDFAFIDGWHTFDHTLIDFYYINRMLKPGGILAVDDVQMPSVNKVMRMIHTYPCYRYHSSVSVPSTKRKKMMERLKSGFRPFARMMGKRLSREFYDASVLDSDESLGLDATVVAFQKVAEDQRPWNWYEKF